MKFGLSLSGLLQHSRDADMVQRFADVLHLVRVARDLGFDYVYAGQHFLSHPFQMLQPLVSLARIGAETDDMDLLSTVLVPLQNPVQMAEDVATLDVLTNGRVIVNAALGYRDEEYEAFGVSREDRIARMFETLRLARLLWAGGEVTFDGHFTKVTRARIGVHPVQRPHPRTWIAANGDGMVRRIARLGETWYLNPHAPFETLARQIALYRTVRAEHGHPPADTLPMSRETFVAPTREQAVAAVRPYLEGKYRAYAAWGQDRGAAGRGGLHRTVRRVGHRALRRRQPGRRDRRPSALRRSGGHPRIAAFRLARHPARGRGGGDPPRRPRGAAGAAVAGGLMRSRDTR